jgi:fibronectin-binding autotransporter adhesin
MLWQLFGHRRPKKSANRKPRRLAVEALEDRWLPSTFNWAGPTSGGDFSTPGNWNIGATPTNSVPGPSDDAVIPSGNTVTVSMTPSVNSVNNGMSQGAQLHIMNGGSLTLNTDSDLSSFTLDNGATLQIMNGTTLLDGGNPATSLAGTVIVNSGAGLTFHTGTINLNNGVSLTGTGAYLLAGATVNLNTAVTAPTDFTLQNGTLTGSGNLNIPDGATFNWTTNGSGQATMSGSGTTTVQANATLNIGGSSARNLDTRTLDNFGTINITGAAFFNLYNAAPLHNEAAGTINLQSDFTIGHGFTTTGVITNDGTINKTSSVNGATDIDVTLTNTTTGTVHVMSGQVLVTQSGTSAGTFTADAGAALNFSGFLTYTLNPGAQITGAGVLDILSGSNLTFKVNGNVSASNLQFDSDIGTINGTGTLTPTNFNWNAGTVAVTTVIPANGTLTIASGGGKSLSGTLTNNGTVNVTSTANVGIGNTTITNTSTGTFNFQSDKDFSGGGGTFINQGTLTKSSQSGGTTNLGPALNNSGTVDVQSGVLNLGGGGNSSGTWKAEDGATLAFNGGTMTLSNGSTLTSVGTGLLTLSGTFATLTISGSVTANTFTISSGNLQGSGTFTVTDTLHFQGGSINNANGTVSIPVGATLLIESNLNKSFSSGTLALAGTTIWKDSGDFNNSGTVNNLAGATFTIQNGQQLGGGKFNNIGTLVKTGTGTSTVVSVFATFINTGTIDVQSGTFDFAGPMTQNAGTTTIETGATLKVGSFLGAPMSLNGGTLNGTGTFNGNLTNAAVVAPGTASSAGTLTLTGTYTQTAAGILSINAGGTTPGSGLSQLAVSGSASLAGLLSLNPVNNFTAALGNSFTVLTFASASGALAVGGPLSPGAGNQFTATRNPTNYTITVTQVPVITPPPPGPGPGPGPSSSPHPLSVTPLTKKVGTKKVLMANVSFSGGLAPRQVRAPFQKPAYQGIVIALRDTNGDGIFDSLLFTARKGSKKVTRTVTL